MNKWQFKIPNILKEAVSQEKAQFSISYAAYKDDIIKTLTITRNKDGDFREYFLESTDEKELEVLIDNFIYKEM